MQTRPMIGGSGSMEFIPCNMPDNSYAFTGMVYLNHADIEALKASSKFKVPKNSKDILVKAGRFILKAVALEIIPQGQIALSAFHREMLNVSKIDKVYLQIANLNDANPLSEIEIKIETKLRGTSPDMQTDDKGAIKVEEDMISQEIFNLFRQNIVNTGQKFAFPIFNQ